LSGEEKDKIVKIIEIVCEAEEEPKPEAEEGTSYNSEKGRRLYELEGST
jgi:hypothetical protein